MVHPDSLVVGVKVAEPVAVRQAEVVTVTVALPPKLNEKTVPPYPVHHAGKSATFVEAACRSTMPLLESQGYSCEPQGPVSVQKRAQGPKPHCQVVCSHTGMEDSTV